MLLRAREERHLGGGGVGGGGGGVGGGGIFNLTSLQPITEQCCYTWISLCVCLHSSETRFFFSAQIVHIIQAIVAA